MTTEKFNSTSIRLFSETFSFVDDLRPKCFLTITALYKVQKGRN